MAGQLVQRPWLQSEGHVTVPSLVERRRWCLRQPRCMAAAGLPWEVTRVRRMAVAVALWEAAGVRCMAVAVALWEAAGVRCMAAAGVPLEACLHRLGMMTTVTAVADDGWL